MSIFNFEFNWNVIAAICPEYRKYLINDSGERAEEIAPIRRRTVIGDNSKEELDIIAEVHSKEDSIERMIPRRDFQQIHEAERNVQWDINPLYDASYARVGKMNPLQLMPPKSVLDIGSCMTFPGRKGWDTQYNIGFHSNRGKAVILHKLHIAERGDKITMIKASYWFDQERNITSDNSGMFKAIIYNKRTRCLYHLFRMQKNVAVKKTARRYASCIRGILWDKVQYRQAIAPYSIELLTTFVDMVEEAVLKDVPDAYVPTVESITHADLTGGQDTLVDWLGNRNLPRATVLTEFMQYKLAILVIQHKVGARLDWLSPNVYDNVSNIMLTRRELILDESMDFYDNSAFRSYRKKQVAKVVPTLRRTKSLKQLLKALLGKSYSNLYLEMTKYIDEISLPDWGIIFKARRDNRMPKYVYHWAMSILKNPMPDTSYIIRQIILALQSIENLNGDIPIRNGYKALESWVKLCKRFTNEAVIIPDWHTWRDMCNMAETLNIRVRPSKLRTSDDIHIFHDNLSDIINRDEKLLHKHKRTIFREFESPDKMYGKFKFTQLRTAAELRDEGRSMHHCVGTYADKCASGFSIIFSMNTPEHSYVTIELNGQSLQYDILQKYTIRDHTVTNDEILALIDEWHKDLLKLHKDDGVTYYDLSQQEDIQEEEDDNRPRVDTAAELDRIQQTIYRLQQRAEDQGHEADDRLVRLGDLLRQALAHGA